MSDSFAVVNAGASGVTVLQDNRPVGRTNLFGALLVPALRSYERNKIAIDPASLPADAVPATTEQVVAPMHQSGVNIDFWVNTSVKAATFTLVDAAGKVIETGSHGRIEGSESSFIVGYDGQTYVRGLGDTSTLVVDLGDHDCRAVVTFDQREGKTACR